MKKRTLFFILILFAVVQCIAGQSAEQSVGVVNLSVCNLHVQADAASEMSTQGLLGMPVQILNHDRWYYIQLPDGYKGWTHYVSIVPMDSVAYNAWVNSEKIIVTSHYGFTYEFPDDSSQSVSDVVSGDRLKWEGSEGDYYKVSYPDGRMAYVRKSISQPEKEWRNTLKKDANSLIRTAKTLMGVPYLWGGTSAKGMDCSGFVRVVFAMHDISLPRDASPLSKVGKRMEIAPDFSNLRPGDLIFFGRKATKERGEAVVHVAIYIGEKRFIHSQGDVHISSFSPADKNYDAFNLNRMLFAVRPPIEP
jgi:hypothetical protein